MGDIGNMNASGSHIGRHQKLNLATLKIDNGTVASGLAKISMQRG